MLARLRNLPRWQRTLWITFFAQVCSAVGFSMIFPFLPLYVNDLGTNTDFSLEFWAGMVFSALGVATVYAAPPHLTAWAWTRNLLRYYLLRPRVTHSHPPESEHAPTEGGFVEHTPYTPTERTQDLTNVARAWPGVGAVERTDGTFEAFLEVHPDTMDFAMSGDWASVQQTAAEFANTELDFPLTMHATTRSFPVEDVVAQLDARLENPGADDADQFRALIEEYRDRRPTCVTPSDCTTTWAPRSTGWPSSASTQAFTCRSSSRPSTPTR